MVLAWDVLVSDKPLEHVLEMIVLSFAIRIRMVNTVVNRPKIFIVSC